MSKTLLNNPRVVWVDDDRWDGGGWFVTLANGWAFDDAIPPGSPEVGEGNACHCHSFANVREALERIRRASPCMCRRCLGEPLKRDPPTTAPTS